MNDLRTITPKRDIARELARKYSTMTHDELDILESILEPVKYGKGEDQPLRKVRCVVVSHIEKGLVRQFYNKNGKGGDPASGCRPYHLYVYREVFQGGAYSSSGGGS